MQHRICVMKFVSFPVVVLAAVLVSTALAAQNQDEAPDMGVAVVATVNDRMISTTDLRERLRLLAISQGGQIPPELLPRLQLQALNDLIDERVKLQEAEKFGLEIDEDSIDREFAQIAAQSGVQPQDLEQALLADGISPEALRGQLRADIAWRRLISGRFRDRVRVTDDEVDQILNRMRAESQRERYAVSEICFALSSPDDIPAIEEAGRQITAAVSQGVPFDRIARQFSSCPSAAAGGDLGVVQPGQLPPEFDSAISRLNSGEISRPIEGDGEYRIFLMREILQAAQSGEPTYEVVHVYTPLSEGVAGRRQLIDAASDGCEGALAARSQTDSLVDGAQLPALKETELNPTFAAALEGLRDGQRTDIVRLDGALHILAVCSVDEGLGLPPRERIEDQLFGQQLELLAQRYLRDIRRTAAIENRLVEGGS
ncbi:MAG: peptidylprolyl isomerase [Pseudomonadota bacterium]